MAELNGIQKYNLVCYALEDRENTCGWSPLNLNY